MNPIDFIAGVFSIVIIDLVLAGDNAILIGMAARNIPNGKRKRVILYGTIGAVVIRVCSTFAFVYLLKIPGLLFAGGLILAWISYKLLIDENNPSIKSSRNVFAAVRTIIIADAIMGLDNVLAVAGAAHGSYLLVAIGLTISIPIMVWGSTFILKLMDRFPAIIFIGAAILAWTSAKMIVKEPFMQPYFQEDWFTYSFEVLFIALVIFLGFMSRRTRRKEHYAR
ncbi:TerC family protein [Metabacillus sp. RGM 3146]|uniref:TerC family protein n=1 Tax=Metabacillus sp. RGM 3146 TaxID=3401092 RepID=UPI003B9AA214